MMHQCSLILPLCALSVSSQQIVSDPGVFGPSIELVHLYNDEFPSGMTTRHLQNPIKSRVVRISSDNYTGIAVSATGRKFTNYPSNLDPNNTKYDVAELTSYDTEMPYPNAEINTPPGGPINYTTGSPGMWYLLVEMTQGIR